MTYDEFAQATDSLESSTSWYHFEGRTPDIVIQCIRHLRKQSADVKISVELEKRQREGLQEIACEADVVFYSKSWAIGNGYSGAEECLRHQRTLAAKAFLLCCTWGDQGAAVYESATGSHLQQPAHVLPGKSVVDTVGAGDTFIAGILYSCLVHADDWTLLQKLTFANQLAGRKVTQEGFANVAGNI
ncbi:hypothetical protein LTR84_007241 [Exophiala bonariae]|uniref:Carbohydrate kinase PfkB domain-containing protein n=1 Tax=Exophiala bonariae TaxID=1690606 RepID=A0AAV9MYX1_9EURO|nr:hypothetical protein LTR84_007241 [Exophiala bonariae]